MIQSNSRGLLSAFTYLLLTIFVLPTNALYFYMNGAQPKCFFEELPKDTLVVGMLKPFTMLISPFSMTNSPQVTTKSSNGTITAARFKAMRASVSSSLSRKSLTTTTASCRNEAIARAALLSAPRTPENTSSVLRRLTTLLTRAG